MIILYYIVVLLLLFGSIDRGCWFRRGGKGERDIVVNCCNIQSIKLKQ